jgi:hypothetical protein
MGLFASTPVPASPSPADLFRERLSRNVIAPATSLDLSANREFCTDLLHASIASRLTYAEDPQAALAELPGGHDLVFAARPRSSPDDSHPWIVCATASAPLTGARTWFVAFPATESVSDLLADSCMCPLGAGHVHIGVMRRASSFSPSFLREWLRPTRSDRVIFTGHSLGGATAAVACLCARQLFTSTILELESAGRLRCLTFGAPAFTDEALARDMHAKWSALPIDRQPFVHIVHRDDATPKVLSTLFSLLSNAWGEQMLSLGPVFRALRCASDLSDLAGELEKNKLATAVQHPWERSLGRLYAPSGAIVELEDDLCWQADASRLLCSPTDESDLSQARAQLRGRSVGMHYTPSPRHWLPSERSAPALEPGLLTPKLHPADCAFARMHSVFEAQLSGENLLWLTTASLLGVTPAGIHTPVQCFDSAVDDASLSASASGATPPSAGASRHWIAKVSAAVEQRFHSWSEPVTVEAFGLFGGFKWTFETRHSDVKDNEVLTELEKLTRRDGRFCDVAPLVVIDRAVFTLTMICHSISQICATEAGGESPLQALARHTVDDSLKRASIDHIDVAPLLADASFDPVRGWLLEILECLENILRGGSSGIVLDTPPWVQDLLVRRLPDRPSRVELWRVKDLAERLLRTGVSFRDERCVVPHDRMDFSVPRMATLQMLSIVASGSDDSFDDVRHQLSGSKTFSPPSEWTELAAAVEMVDRVRPEFSRLAALMVAESMVCDVDEFPPIGRSSTLVRALCRTAFEDVRLFERDVGGVFHVLIPTVLALSLLPVVVRPADELTNYIRRSHEPDWQSSVRAGFLGEREPANSVEFRERIVDKCVVTMAPERDYRYSIERFFPYILWNLVPGIHESQRALLQSSSGAHTLQRHRAVLQFLLRHLRVPAGRKREEGVGDMFSLECQLRDRVRELGSPDIFCSPIAGLDDKTRESRVWDVFTAPPLAPAGSPCNIDSFHHCLRSALMVHQLRQLMSSTYIIALVGIRGAGKSCTAREVLGLDAVSGATERHSTKDVQPFFLPVEGPGPIKRLIVLDVPGSDDILASSSLFADEEFRAADLIVTVARQERAATEATSNLLHSIVASSGGLEPAIAGRSKVCSWGELAEPPARGRCRVAPMPLVMRCLRPSVRKVACLMTHADEQLTKVAQQMELDGVTCDSAAKACELANDALSSLRQALVNGMGLLLEGGVDEMAVASCCVSPFPLDHGHVVKTAIDEGAILDAAGVRDFLAQMVPPEVAAVIRGRTPFRRRS